MFCCFSYVLGILQDTVAVSLSKVKDIIVAQGHTQLPSAPSQESVGAPIAPVGLGVVGSKVSLLRRRLELLSAEVDALYEGKSNFRPPSYGSSAELVAVALDEIRDNAVREACEGQPTVVQLGLILSKGFGIEED